MPSRFMSLLPSTWAMAGGDHYPLDLLGVTHGWRWYRVEAGKLHSPLQGYPLQLPRDGHLPGAYFIPSAVRMWPMVLMLRDKRWYDFALTFGTVSGPFMRDFQMPRLGSMSASEYQAQVILSDGNVDIDDGSYDLPVFQQEIELGTLKRVETTVTRLADTS